ncbi:MAG: 50S ribosomal protein L23 [Armatimonadetes bacterium]|nr:50S ribosomal protein L23 [Armatimonadota bacterium]
MITSARDIIVRPIVTEKTMVGLQSNKYTFEVADRANKVEIRKAVEGIFKVRVLKVTTSTVRGKARGSGRTRGKTPDWKKATVTLKEGDKIAIKGVEIFEQ